MMKKLVTLILALTLALGLCIPAANAETTTVKFWTHLNNAWNDNYKELIAEFEAQNPDIKIEYEQFPYADFEAKIQTSLLTGGAGADIYEVWGGWMLDLVANDVLSEMSAEFAAELKEDTYAPVLGTLEKDGKYYGAPLELNVEYGGIVTHKRLFEESGLAYPTTWEEVLDIARKVAVEKDGVMEMRGLEYATSDNLTANYLAMILQNGGEYRKEDGSLDFTTPEAVSAMKELVSWIKDEHLTSLESSTGSLGYDGHAFIGLDECYMVTRGPWVLADLVTTYGMEEGVDFDYIPQPAFVEGVSQRWVAETGWSLCVAKNTSVADAAWKFVKFVMDPDNMLRHNVACAQIPPRKSVANNPEFIENAPYIKALLDNLDNAEFIGKFNSDVLKDTIRRTFVSLCSDDGTYTSVEDACQKMTENLAANLKIY